MHGGAGGTEISNQISALARVWTPNLTVRSPARYPLDYRTLLNGSQMEILAVFGFTDMDGNA